MSRCYSPVPKEAYSIPFDGNLYGVGMHPVFDVVPGAWNLTWLLAARSLENLLNYNGDPGEYPTYLPGALPHATGTALQRCGEGLKTWGELAEELPPNDLLRRMRSAADPNIPILVKYYGETILEVMAEHASLYVPLPGNVVHIAALRRKAR